MEIIIFQYASTISLVVFMGHILTIEVIHVWKHVRTEYRKVRKGKV